MNKTWCVVWRRGGTENFEWLRTLPMTREEADTAQAEVERGGRLAMVVDLALSLSVGLPETYGPTESTRYWNRLHGLRNAPRFETAPYERSHGSRPRGQGSWAFCPEAKYADGVGYLDHVHFVTGLYGEAKRAAAKHFAMLGVAHVVVCP